MKYEKEVSTKQVAEGLHNILLKTFFDDLGNPKEGIVSLEKLESNDVLTLDNGQKIMYTAEVFNQ